MARPCRSRRGAHPAGQPSPSVRCLAASYRRGPRRAQRRGTPGSRRRAHGRLDVWRAGRRRLSTWYGADAGSADRGRGATMRGSGERVRAERARQRVVVSSVRRRGSAPTGRPAAAPLHADSSSPRASCRASGRAFCAGSIAASRASAGSFLVVAEDRRRRRSASSPGRWRWAGCTADFLVRDGVAVRRWRAAVAPRAACAARASRPCATAGRTGRAEAGPSFWPWPSTPGGGADRRGGTLVEASWPS